MSFLNITIMKNEVCNAQSRETLRSEEVEFGISFKKLSGKT